MTEPAIRVEVVYALPSRAWRITLDLPAGARVADALAAADLASRIPGLEIDGDRIAVFGHAVALDRVLAHGDRVEVLRPLQCDPKEIRRRRARGDG